MLTSKLNCIRAGLTISSRSCLCSVPKTKLRVSRRELSTGTVFNRRKNDDEPFIEVKPPPLKDPLKRTFDILKHDMKSVVDPFQPSNIKISNHVDIAIIGGGVMGSAIAYYLKERVGKRNLRILVLEKDPSYTRSSTVLSVGGLRQQFSLKENIQMSLYSADFLRNVPEKLGCEDGPAPDVQFNPQGYLFMATAQGADQLKENYILQTELGAKIELLSQNKLKEKFPWIKCDDIELATHGIENEGWFDPWSLLTAFKQKSISLGVEYAKADVIGFDFKETLNVIAGMDNDEKHTGIESIIVKLPDGDIQTVRFGVCVLAAGYESGNIAEMARIGRGPGILSVPLPVEPRKRYVYCIHAPNGPGLDCPLVVDPSGAYMRREGYANNYLAGQSPPLADEPNTETLDVDYTYFDNTVWPNLANRIPSLENAKVKSAWAGYYDYNSFDQNAIIGPHPYYPNLYIATGFSGHGIQQAPAVGRAIMEMVLDGEFVTIDLTKFHFERFLVGKEVRERNIV